MAWPPGSWKTRDQPLTGDEPVFVMVMLSVSPVFQALTVSVTRQLLPGAGELDWGDPLGLGDALLRLGDGLPGLGDPLLALGDGLLELAPATTVRFHFWLAAPL